jgi:hypothetical protein
MSAATFGNWLSRLAVAALAFALLSAGICLLSHDYLRYGIDAFILGLLSLILWSASCVLRTNPRLSITLVNGAMYLGLTSIVLSEFKNIWSNSGVLPGAAGFVISIVDVVIATAIFLFIRAVMAEMKPRLLSEQTHHQE